MTEWVAQLCTHVGVHAEYRGFEGQTIKVHRDTQVAVLRALGFDIGADDDAQSALNDLQAEKTARPLPPEVIVEAGKPSTLTLAHPAHWALQLEDAVDTQASGQDAKTLTLPSLPLGIHQLRLSTPTQDFVTWVLARPAHAVQLKEHIPEGCIWGVQAALYGMTDGKAAKIGTYDLLGQYGAAMAVHGADFLGINPVHAMGENRPEDVISPYSPSHRGFLNTWHCSGGGADDAGDLVDYPSALRATAHTLQTQFEAFQSLGETAPEKQAFGDFVVQKGKTLGDFAVFEALTARISADWRDWPAPYRTHDSAALAEFATLHANNITRIKWAQWQAEVQLSNAQAKACDAGMRVGLYLDLAVGPRLGGAETWMQDSALVTGATLGAPPDPLGPLGQNWGLAPLSPMKCRAEGYAGFARLLRANMRHAGMMRIDHVLGLMRSFWIPEGGAEGTYVSYPVKALLAVVAIESRRNNTIVVGEDLGLVPEGLRADLAESGIYGLDVLQYMRVPTGGFVDTSKTRKLAVCTFATHDTPTIAGFFAAQDAQVRHETGGIDAETLAQTRADRAQAQETLAAADPVPEVHRRLARARASMVAVQLDDIAERTAQQNVPGTVDSYPNWRLKASFTLDEIRKSDAFTRLSRDMAAQNRANPKRIGVGK